MGGLGPGGGEGVLMPRRNLSAVGGAVCMCACVRVCACVCVFVCVCVCLCVFFFLGGGRRCLLTAEGARELAGAIPRLPDLKHLALGSVTEMPCAIMIQMDGWRGGERDGWNEAWTDDCADR